MAGYQVLSNFERGFIVGAREMGHSISEVAMKFVYSHTTISRVYHEYRVSGKTSNLRLRRDQKKTLKERNRRCLARNLKRVRRATLLQIAAHFNDGALRNVSVRTAERRPSLIWVFGTDVQLVYRCGLYGTQLYASPGPANAVIELLMTLNKLPGLTSLVSNCIGWMDMYWYGDNLMNPWTQHMSTGNCLIW
ncbi:hypothetical protein AVEN_146640-1 [Araneus ventricosus]|uniref:Tc3 transposase DNA binding domain-containing protein n=1 Tax=Araneus ventricosus TaxID=182803 RepID=A0A4Y2JHK9_ARAVE|nr:hypothetical protein AVEN_146640-1 [Araneus ventricosus]